MQLKIISIFIGLWLFAIGNDPFIFTKPILLGYEISNTGINATIKQEQSVYADFSKAIITFINLPDSLNGNSLTIIGGGLNGEGLHNIPDASEIGHHFARTPEGEGANVIRDSQYKSDFTREVIDGHVTFTFYYRPTNINEWGERYPPGSEVALTIMLMGTEHRILHAVNNEFNWSFGNVGAGNSVEITINFNPIESSIE